jgi:hypothetical protein
MIGVEQTASAKDSGPAVFPKQTPTFFPLNFSSGEETPNPHPTEEPKDSGTNESDKQSNRALN